MGGMLDLMPSAHLLGGLDVIEAISDQVNERTAKVIVGARTGDDESDLLPSLVPANRWRAFLIGSLWAAEVRPQAPPRLGSGSGDIGSNPLAI